MSSANLFRVKKPTTTPTIAATTKPPQTTTETALATTTATTTAKTTRTTTATNYQDLSMSSANLFTVPSLLSPFPPPAESLG